jgi:hypothetical protein
LAEGAAVRGQAYPVRAAVEEAMSGGGLKPLHGPGQRGRADVAVSRGAGEAECLREVEEEPVLVVVLHLSPFPGEDVLDPLVARVGGGVRGTVPVMNRRNSVSFSLTTALS